MSPDIEWRTDDAGGGERIVVVTRERRLRRGLTAGLLIALVGGLALLFGYRDHSEAVPGPKHIPTPTALEAARAGQYRGKIVTIGDIYGERWATAFRRSFLDFENETGIDVWFVTVEPESAEFVRAIEAGTGPDLVEFSSSREMWYFARDGKIVDITTVMPMSRLLEQYDRQWVDWATMQGPDGPIVAGVWGPVWVRNTIWYPKAAFERAGYKVPTTWQELIDLSDQIVKDGGTPWCLQNGSIGGGSVGVPAQSWISDLMLRTAPDDFDAWMLGEIKSTAPPVQRAIQLMSDIWFRPGYAQVDRQALNTTYQWDIDQPLFDDPPTCWMAYVPSWSTEWNGKRSITPFMARKFGVDYDFFILPPIDPAYGAPVQVDAHITALLNDRPEARALMEYVITGKALENWIKSDIRFGFSPHKDADPDWSDEPRERALARAIVEAQAAGTLSHSDGYWIKLEPEIAALFLQSISAYVAGDLDLETAMTQVDEAAAGARGQVAPEKLQWNAVWGSSNRDVFAAGYAGEPVYYIDAAEGWGQVMHYDGRTWSSMEIPRTGWLGGIWGSSGVDVFAVGEAGAILHYDGHRWESMDSGTLLDLIGIWGSSPIDVYAVGVGSTILHFDGRAWSVMPWRGWVHLIDVWGRSDDDVYAAGINGTVLHYDGRAWSSMESGISITLWTIAGTTDGNVFLGGDNNTILRYDGGVWSPASNLPGPSLRDMWAVSADDIFAVGIKGVIVHYDGSGWSLMPGGVDFDLNAVWANSGRDVFAVGANNTLLHYDGQTWSSMSDGPDQ